MKIYISADIEGVCGSTAWDETDKSKPAYAEFQGQMTREVTAACEGAFEAGATEILIKDAHSTGRNIIARDLPKNTRLVRGWSRHPYMMMQEIDGSFHAAVMIGYHAMAGAGGNPLAHTMSSARIATMSINGQNASEFLINSQTAFLEKVPVAFISGDQDVCDEAEAFIPGISTVAAKTGAGASTVNIHPDFAVEQIRSGVKRALSGDLSGLVREMPEHFEIIVNYLNIADAFKASFYPGAQLKSPRSVFFEAQDYFDVLRFFLFNL